jgi:pimeloyl-ACP methyl ester carboxylesterase
MLHSSMSSKAQWSELAALLAPHWHCVGVDLLGYGQAAFPLLEDGARFTLAHEVDAVNAALAAQLEPGQPFHLLGHSYGGATALRLALEMPARILSLALFEPVAFHLLPAGDAARAEIGTVIAAIEQAATPRDGARAFIDYWNRAGAFDSLKPAQQDRFTAQIAKVRLDFQALSSDPAMLADLAPLTMPALVIAGQSSPASTRGLAEQLAAALPGARLLHARGGHMAPITHSLAVNPLIVAFLDAQMVAASGLANAQSDAQT